MGYGTNVVLASKDQLSKTIGSLAGLATSQNGAPVVATVSTKPSTAANNVLGSGPAVSVSSSANLCRCWATLRPVLADHQRTPGRR